MLPKVNRLTKENSRGLFFNKKISSNLCLLLVAKGKTSHPPRITVVVSKKVSLKAVDRNRVKRIVREIVLWSLPSLPENLNIIIRPNREILGKEKEEIRKDLEEKLLSL